MTNYYNSLCNGRDIVHKKTRFGASGGSPNTTKTSRWWLASFFMVMSLFVGQNVVAQISAYTFTQSTGTYADLSSPTVLGTSTAQSGAASLDDVVYNLPAGSFPFTFTFDGVGYTGCNVSTNGFITFGATAPSTTNYTPISNTATYAGAIAAWGGDANSPFNLGGKTGSISWAVVGTAPSREVVIQWKDVRPAFSTSTTTVPYINYQIRLQETSNNVVLTYGPSGIAVGTTNSSTTKQIGLRGANNTFATNVKNRTNATTVSFNSSTAGTANTSTQAYSSLNALPGTPTNGLVYTFAPFVPVLPPDCATGLVPANLATDIARNPTLSWTAATGGPVSYDIYFGDSSPAVFVTNVSAATLSYQPGLLNSNTTYYWKVIAKNANGDAVGCTEQSFTTGTSLVYCSSGLTTSGGTSDTIAGVTVGTYVSGAIGGVAPWYTAVANTPIDIVAPSNQPISITMGTDGAQHSAVWIDFNQNGIYEATENVALSTAAAGANAVVNYTLVIPSTATLGVTRMRVRGAGDSAYTAAGACTGQSWGETEDYLVNLIAPPPSPPDCATALTPGDLSSDLPRNLTLTWAAATGFPTSYDVYLSTASGSTTPVANVTGTSYTPATLDANTQYFWSVIPKNENGEAIGCAEQSFITGTSFNYCAAVPTSIDGNGITNVVLETLSNPNVSTATYQNFTSGLPVPDLGTSLTIPMSVTFQTGFTYATRVFIDFNQDGDFNDASENQLLGTSTATNPTTLSGTISIPSDATAGNTRMRVIGYDNDGNNACYSGSFANVEDYTVNITITPPCSGAPAAAVASSSVSGACVGVAFTLSVTGQTNGLGITYQWESATDAAFTQNVTALGTSLTQAIASQSVTTYYRFSTTCATGPDTTYSNVVEVTQNAPTQCYCTPIYTTGKTDGDLISNISISGTTLANNSGTAQVNPAYTYFTGQPNYTAELQAGSTYSVTVTVGTWGTQGIAAWIDYDDDGVFESTEKIGNTAGTIGTGTGGLPIPANHTASFNITLSCNPPLGVHRMRVRDVFNQSGAIIDPCNSQTFGETEDYDITITAPDPCPTPSNLAAASVTTSGASLSWTLGCAETEWDVNIQPAGSGVPTSASNPGLTATTFAASGLSAGTAYEFYVRAVCQTGVLSSNWAGPFAFTTLPNVPGCATLLTPSDAATGVANAVTMTWSAPAVTATEGPAASYKVYFGTTNPPTTLVSSPTTTSYTRTGLNYSTTYYWSVTSVNASGDSVGCASVYSFTTEADPFAPYCSTISFTTDVEPISSVVFAGINNVSNPAVDASPALENFIAVSGNVTANSSYSMTLKGHTGGNFTTNLRVFADWNQDGDFADAGETYNAGSLTNSNGIDAVSAVSNIAVPINALPGTTRMRVKKIFGTTNIDDSCVGAGYGQVEDYSLNVTGLTTSVKSPACGSTLASVTSLVQVNNFAVSANITGYRFKASGPNGDLILEKTTPHFQFNELPGWQYGTTYTVSCELQAGGVWAGYYGPTCTLSTPNAVTLGLSQIVSPTCGSTVAMNTSIATTSLAGVTGYRFRVTNTNPEYTGANAVQVIDRTLQWFTMSQLAEYIYGTTYTVEVAVKTTGSYGAYGPACTLSTLAVPSINQCGTTVAAGSLLSTTSLPAVTQYTFEVTNMLTQVVQVINRTTQTLPTTSITGYSSTTPYSIRLAVTSTGVMSSYGLDCLINEVPANKEVDSEVAFRVKAFPNPFTNNFTLAITRTSEENVSVMVYDMIGKVLDKVTVNATDSNSLELGANYPAGVYNVVVSQGEKVETVRMIKQ